MLLISTAKTSPPSFFTSLNNKSHGNISIKPQNSFFFSKNFNLLLPPLYSSYTTTLSVSSSPTKEYKNPNLNRKINELCEVGNLRKAIELLDMTPKIEIESSTYCSILQLCAEFNSLKDGKRVHSIISASKIPIDGLLGTKLVFMYVNCGDIREGRRVFDKVANEKVFLWNFMLNGYAKIGAFEESVYIFRKMLGLEIKVNSHTFSCVLKCFAALGSVKEGEWVHGYLLKLGFGSYNAVVNSLIAFYFKVRKVRSALKVFDELTDRDVVTWNSMVSGLVDNDLPEEGIQIFIEMVVMGVGFDLTSMVIVLAACANCGNVLLGRAVHALAIKASFDRRLTFANTLLDMYSKCGDLTDATRVFKKMGEKSVVSWTSLIAGYAREGLSGDAMELFREMEREGVRPDIFTVTMLLHACACNESLENGREVHNYIRRNNMQLDLYACNALMDMYAKCGSMEEANAVFLEMPTKDIISWNTMIGGYSKNGLPNEALCHFIAMLQERKPDNRTLACILPACGSLAALDRGREIHGYILRNGCFSDQHAANALVDMYVKCGAIALAQLLFDRIAMKDLISWTVMIAGYGMHGFGKEAIAAFQEMRQAGIEPDEISFISILYACSHSGLLDEGWKFFNIMQHEYNIKPELEHYACVVDLLARSGKLAMAYKFIKSMPVKPNVTIWGSLLCGCRTHHNIKLAEKVAEHVFELEPENTGYYVLLANIYSDAEKWEEVKKLRERIGRQVLKKNPSCSWIEVKGKVNIFVAGDTSHPQTQKIESLLRKLRSKMKEEDYFRKMRYALLNEDTLEKEIALCGHSEKLAMAFGILNFPPGKAIRVTKNLRICSDCHETAKFISKTQGREVVLRDSNRFHHFKDGACSCRGF
ncbi:pentatricopeptide repeat-containing protein DOT4, chloroplastic [Mercurialis annua]|uniref:pentatricopeptide repeat-containing protein DOT4, chloroplastic n=1 Tax=Mercurialis annua TaxID=3986 RepID=UPI0021604778|nr:pentatricopeptide repeat-containing protein DOT4, chloroplastic [Mercurialis annua]XP_050225587.1 pentatricopeptide repeat-containing protein DOT4, chloroplastic [Mercurialis annua]